ncbi:MAG: hypothetical protein HYT37_02205 [Candidatus Sungbacteria bacterium]|nr:hypothetical protein [Candidatus Sungbacteria bacterium]
MAAAPSRFPNLKRQKAGSGRFPGHHGAQTAGATIERINLFGAFWFFWVSAQLKTFFCFVTIWIF